jgi:hypothetical protein
MVCAAAMSSSSATTSAGFQSPALAKRGSSGFIFFA